MSIIFMALLSTCEYLTNCKFMKDYCEFLAMYCTVLYPRSGKNWRRSEATAVIIRGSLLSPQAWPVRIPTGRRRQVQGSLLWQVKVFFPVVSSQPWLSRATSAHADHNNKTVCGVPTVGLTIVTGRGACEEAELCPVERNLLIKKVGSRFLFPLF